jgi:cystathionine beta-lyase/cystathionine gamma-synthase
MKKECSGKRFGTKAIWAGTHHIKGSVVTPIFNSSTYELTDDIYRGWKEGAQHTLLYSRISSVNSEAVSSKIAILEAAEDGEMFDSGMSAISTTLLALLSNGDHMVGSADMYGGAYGLITEEFPRFGIEATMADIRDPASYEAAIKNNTKLLYVETITNPVLKVCDLEAMAAIAKKHNLIAICDNTFASPWACNPISMGFDLVIHSASKYLGGHSDLIGGLVVGNKQLISEIFSKKITMGGAADPHMCYLLERGIRTLHVRMPTHAQNAAELAQRLNAHPMIESVNHCSLPDYPDYEVARRIIPKGSGMLSYVVKGGNEAALHYLRCLEFVFEATSLGGVESLAECPFNTSHMFMPEELRAELGIVPGFVRMSVGIEDVEDLWEDMDHALKATKTFINS